VVDLLRAVRWDWFKLSRRRIPWILLAVLLVMSQLSLLAAVGLYQGLRHSGGPVVLLPQENAQPVRVRCRDIAGGNFSSLPDGTPDEVARSVADQCQSEQARFDGELAVAYRSITMPSSIVQALNLGLAVELVLLAILAASHVGAEHAWGTVRTNLARGVGRGRYLGARFIVLTLLAGGALLAILVVSAFSSVVVQHFIPAPGQLPKSDTWAHVAQAFGKGWIALIPYLLLTGAVTVLSRSSAAAMAIAIGYYLGEHVVVGIVGSLSTRTQAVARYLLGQNIDAWAGISLLGLGHTRVGATHALLVLIAYAAALGVAAFYVFERQDIGGASTG
jgi:ABC-type transport system involved in multi-copper enzyme maturation permease subunit